MSAPFPPPDLELHADIPFSTHGLKLDLLRARVRPARPAPAVLHLHGGAWVMYGKWAPANVALARAGFVTVSSDYRLAPGAVFPAPLHDAKAAVRWLRAHAAEWHIDPARIGAWGVSAGAHLAALLGTTAGDAELEGAEGGWVDSPSHISAVGNVCGPTDFADPAWTWTDEPFPLIGAPVPERPDLAAWASPVTHVTPSAAPFLHLHGTHDQDVPVSQARRLHAALSRAGVPSTLTELDGDHFINDTHQAEVDARLIAFFRETLGVLA